MLVLPLVVTFFRGHPESYGLLPDGEKEQRDVGTELPKVKTEPELTLPQAQRTVIFWLFVAGGIAISALVPSSSFTAMRS